MPLSYVGGNKALKAGATSGNSNLSLTALTGGSASSAAAGDIVIAVFATGSAADRTLLIQDPGGTAYTLINSERYANGTTYDSNLRVAYKILTAADANTVFGPTGNAQDAGAMAVHVWRGVDTSNPLDVTAVGTQGTGTGRPNPPAITPTTTGAIVIATGGAAAATGAIFVGTGLSNFVTETSPDTNDAMVGIGSFAWVSGSYDPAAWTGGTTNAADSWTSITLALRPSVNQTLTPNLYTNTQTFFAPTVTATYALTPALYTNDQTFYAPTVTTSNTLTPDLYTNTQTFYSPDVSQAGGAQTLTPDLYTNVQTFYQPTVSTSYELLPALYTNDQTFYSPTISQASGAQDLLPALYTNDQTFYSATVSTTYELTPALYTNTQSFYAPTITTTVDIKPSLFTNTQTFYSPTVSAGATQQDITFADYVDSGYVEDGYVTWIASFQAGNQFFAPTLQQFAQRGEGWIPQIKRKRKWKEEADERVQLRKVIEHALDPVEAKEAEVVTVQGKVAVLPKGERGIPIPVPPNFDAQAVARLVMQVLHDKEIEAKRVREAQARAAAREIISAWMAENERKRIKRRREEEIMLLM